MTVYVKKQDAMIFGVFTLESIKKDRKTYLERAKVKVEHLIDAFETKLENLNYQKGRYAYYHDFIRGIEKDIDECEDNIKLYSSYLENEDACIDYYLKTNNISYESFLVE